MPIACDHETSRRSDHTTDRCNCPRLDSFDFESGTNPSEWIFVRSRIRVIISVVYEPRSYRGIEFWTNRRILIRKNGVSELKRVVSRIRRSPASTFVSLTIFPGILRYEENERNTRKMDSNTSACASSSNRASTIRIRFGIRSIITLFRPVTSLTVIFIAAHFGKDRYRETIKRAD